MKRVRGTVQWTYTTIYNIYNTTFYILDCSKYAPVNKGVLEMSSADVV